MALTKPNSDMLDMASGLRAGSELAITTGSVTPVENSHVIDTESDAASDDLATIVTTNVEDGGMLLIFAANTARTVVVKHGTDNIYLNGDSDMSLDDDKQSILLRRSGANFHEVARAKPAAPELAPLDRITGAQTSYNFETGVNSTYRNYRLLGWVQPVNDDVDVWMRTDANGGASFDAGATDYKWSFTGLSGGSSGNRFSAGDTKIVVGGGIAGGDSFSNASDNSVFVDISFVAPADASLNTLFITAATGVIASSTGLGSYVGGGVRDSAAIIDAVQLLFESGNVADGDVTLYGIANA
jgi:hypothetical protein